MCFRDMSRIKLFIAENCSHEVEVIDLREAVVATKDELVEHYERIID